MLLKNQGVGVLLVTDWTLVKHSHRGLGPVNAHVCLQVTLGSKCPSTDPALERSLAGVCAVVHLQS